MNMIDRSSTGVFGRIIKSEKILKKWLTNRKLHGSTQKLAANKTSEERTGYIRRGCVLS